MSSAPTEATLRLHPHEIDLLVRALRFEAEQCRVDGEQEMADSYEARASEVARAIP
jgi:hypothetical protein